MSVEISEVGIEEAIVHFQTIPAHVRDALAAQVYIEAADMVTVVKEEKLSGQVLGQRTRHLRDSVHVLEMEANDQSVEAAVGVNLGDAKYAAFWEYGFTGDEQVREHLRHITQAFGKPISPRDVMVREHIRHVDQPARSYLRSTLAERAEGIRSRILGAAMAAMGGAA